jgi:two-component system, LytTR family, sensor kinase
MASLNNLVPGFFRRKAVLYHSMGWGFFICYEVLFVTLLVGFRSDVSIWWGYMFPYAVNIALFYFHAHITLFYSFNGPRKHYLLFVLLMICELALYLLLMNSVQLINQGAGWFSALSGKTEMMGLLRQLWRGIYFIGFSSAYWFALRTIHSEKKVSQLEKLQIINRAEKNNLEKNLVELQNAHLQAQINPHLLFNTLNFIYNKVQEVSQDASEAVILLSELMNYSLRELEPDGKVSVEKEVEQISNIIKINQIRFNNKLFLQLESNGNFREARVIPLILIPLIENVFKHGDLTDKGNPGKVTINYDGCYLEMTTFNKKKKREKIYSHGIGMINVTKRLDNIYKDRYTLNMTGDKDDYHVFLRIKLNPE